jgi:hypothetical protein
MYWLVEPVGDNMGEAHIVNMPTKPAIDNPDWHVSGPYETAAEAAEFEGAGESL